MRQNRVHLMPPMSNFYARICVKATPSSNSRPTNFSRHLYLSQEVPLAVEKFRYSREPNRAIGTTGCVNGMAKKVGGRRSHVSAEIPADSSIQCARRSERTSGESRRPGLWISETDHRCRRKDLSGIARIIRLRTLQETVFQRRRPKHRAESPSFNHRRIQYFQATFRFFYLPCRIVHPIIHDVPLDDMLRHSHCGEVVTIQQVFDILLSSDKKSDPQNDTKTDPPRRGAVGRGFAAGSGLRR